MNNVSNLKVNMEFKNYKAIASFLKEPIKQGKSKQLQLERWRVYFDWKQEKYKFIITEIHNNPIVPVSRNSKYSMSLDGEIITSVSHHENGEAIYTYEQCFLEFGFVNKNYSNYNLLRQWKIESKCPDSVYNNIRNLVHRKNCEVLESALDRLNDRAILFSNKSYFIVDRNNQMREATVDEQRQILIAQRSVLDEMGLESKSAALLKKRYKEFMDKVNEKLWCELKVNHTTKCLHFIYDRDKLIEDCKKYFGDKHKFNSILSSAIYKSGERAYQNHLAKINEELKSITVGTIDVKNTTEYLHNGNKYCDNYLSLLTSFIDKFVNINE